MSDVVDITEITELDAQKVAGVQTPANGTEFLLVKSAKAATPAKGGASSTPATPAKGGKAPTKGGKVPVNLDGSATTDADGDGDADKKDWWAQNKAKVTAKSNSSEVDDQEEEMTGETSKGTVQDALNGTDKPAEGSAALATGTTDPAFTEPMTGGVKNPDAVAGPAGTTPNSLNGPRQILRGGESAYVIPKDKLNGPATISPGAYFKATGMAAFNEMIDKVMARREAAKAQQYLETDNPGPKPVASMSMDQIAQNLAACAAGLDQLQLVQSVASVTGDGSLDPGDCWDLTDAATALDFALGVAARLAYQQGATSATKSATIDLDSVAAAYNELASVLEATTKASSSGEPLSAKEDMIVTDVTKGELAELVVQAVKTVSDQEREAAKQAKKAKAKKAAKKAKKLAKNANNNGDITLQQEKAGVSNEVSSDGIATVGTPVDPKFVNKSAEDKEVDDFQKSVTESLTKLGEGLTSVTEQVSKFARKPRVGGPSLDGQARGEILPAAEGRIGDLTKSQVDGDIERLEKSLADETDPIAKERIGNELTHQKLIRLHMTGEL